MHHAGQVSPANPRRVVLVEDYPALAENIAELLGDAGFDAKLVASDDELDRAIDDAAVSLVLIDGQDLDPEDLVRRIRVKRPQLGVVVRLDHDGDARCDRLRSLGCHAVIVAPFDWGELVLLASRWQDAELGGETEYGESAYDLEADGGEPG